MLSGIGAACFLSGDDEQAFFWADKAFLENSAHLATQRIYAISAARTGRMDKASEGVRSMIARVPSETLGVARRHFEREMRWKPQEKIEKIIEALRFAGLPE